MTDIRTVLVSRFDFSYRPRHCLECAGIRKVSQLVALTWNDLRRLRFPREGKKPLPIGRKACREIIEVLAMHGLWLGIRGTHQYMLTNLQWQTLCFLARDWRYPPKECQRNSLRDLEAKAFAEIATSGEWRATTKGEICKLIVKNWKLGTMPGPLAVIAGFTAASSGSGRRCD
jgi:hypothetical protein